MQNTDEGRDFIKQSLSYFFWKWPYKSEIIKMDSPEALKNKGYEQERKKNEIESAARDKKIAEYLHSIGVPAESITAALAIK